MKYDAFAWNDRGWAVVYGGTREIREEFSRGYLKRHPNVRGDSFDFIVNYKKGFLQKRKTIQELLVSQAPKNYRKEAEAQIEKNSRLVGLDQYKYRAPRAMGIEIEWAWTIMCAALWGEENFLVRDFGTEGSRKIAARLVSWLRSYNPNTSIVWVTGCPEEELLRPIFSEEEERALADMTYLSQNRAFWRLQDGEILECDCDALEAWHNARMAEERARREAAIAEALREGAELEEQEEYRKALEIYDKLADQKCTEAMVRAARLYFDEKGEGSALDQSEKARSLCRRADTAEAYILAGDHEMKYVERHSDDADIREDTKSAVVSSLKQAAEYYRTAAKQGSAEGCYKAAELHLRFTFSRESSSDWKSFSYDQTDAIPYIKQLLEYEEAGEDVAIQLLLLRVHSNSTYEMAKKEYKTENQKA